MTDQLDRLAQSIATTELAATQAVAAAGDAETRRQTIVARIEALGDVRASIVARRAAGDYQADDGPRLELAAADSEGLAAMLPDAEAVVAAARARLGEANAAVASAKHAFACEEARLTLAELDRHADELAGLLQETLRQRQAAAAVLPAGERGLARIISRGQVLETLVLDCIMAARAAPSAAPYGSRPIWKPGDTFHNEIVRLHLNSGRLS